MKNEPTPNTQQTHQHKQIQLLLEPKINLRIKTYRILTSWGLVNNFFFFYKPHYAFYHLHHYCKYGNEILCIKFAFNRKWNLIEKTVCTFFKLKVFPPKFYLPFLLL